MHGAVLISQHRVQQHSLRHNDRQKTEITKIRRATSWQPLRGPNTLTARASWILFQKISRYEQPSATMWQKTEDNNYFASGLV